MTERNIAPITVVIPTYMREQVLLDTLAYLTDLESVADEIIVVDQTADHHPDTIRQLEALAGDRVIRWIRLPKPSITGAMNRGLVESRNGVVLFLDDDIRPGPGLIEAHLVAHSVAPNLIIAGRVIQPWQENEDFLAEGPFRFCDMRAAWVDGFIGANFSVQRQAAIDLGGFDENFVRVAYRYEAEFSHRFRQSGGRVRFEPNACVHHLKASGGTRSFGDYLATWKPDHAVGAYYFALRALPFWGVLREFSSRLLGSVLTRHHLRRPWWIPVTLVAELSGMIWAAKLAMAGPRFVNVDN